MRQEPAVPRMGLSFLCLIFPRRSGCVSPMRSSSVRQGGCPRRSHGSTHAPALLGDTTFFVGKEARRVLSSCLWWTLSLQAKWRRAAPRVWGNWLLIFWISHDILPAPQICFSGRDSCYSGSYGVKTDSSRDVKYSTDDHLDFCATM